MKFYCQNSNNKGLGDWFAGRTKTFGIDRLAHWFAKRVLGRISCKCPNRQNQLNSLYPCDTPRLTIAIPTYNDYSGLWATVTSIVTQADKAGLLEKIEILVVDQSPDVTMVPPESANSAPVQAGELNKGFIENWVDGTKDKLRAKYVRWNHKLGTTVAKSMCFQASSTEWTLCMDSHVILEADSLANTYRWICENRNRDGLYNGVLLYDGSKAYSTHLEPVWRGGMWGTWATDERGKEPSLKPFDVPAAAGWLFMCRTDAWLGYHPLMDGFGGEETFLQKLWQRHGRVTQCLPSLRGHHRFGRTDEVAPVDIRDKIRNAALGYLMLGENLEEVRAHFGEQHEEDGELVLHADPQHVDLIIAGAKSEHMNMIGMQDNTQPASPAPVQSQRPATLEDLYVARATVHSDINEHLPTLRKYASRCDHVTEFGTRSAVSTVAFLVAQPKVLHTWDLHEQCPCKSLASLAGSTEFHVNIGDVTKIDPIEPTELLFIDTYHNSEQMAVELEIHAPQVSRYIIMHDTETFWENGESYDGSPKTGLKAAVEAFLDSHSEWSIREKFSNNNGLLILERS